MIAQFPMPPPRKPVLLAASSAALLFSMARSAFADDSWWGRDKALHFGVSAAIGGAGYGLSSLVFEDRALRVISSAGLALAAGVGKELYDASGHGTASYKDLTWDLAGTTLGVGLCFSLDWALSRRDRPAASQARLNLRF
jgi:putative lipoprotein